MTWNAVATTYLHAYLNGTWVDISDRLLVGERGAPIYGSVGRATELAQTDPSYLSLALENADGWLTPDNPLGGYYPYWKTGVALRWSETIGAKTFTFPDVFIQIPEVALTFEDATDSSHSDRILIASCTDRLTKLDSAPQFVGMLGEFIRHEGGDDLKCYWPLNEPAGVKVIAARVQPAGADLRMRALAPATGGMTPVSGSPGILANLITFGNDPLLADDSPTAEFTLDAATNYGVLKALAGATLLGGFSMSMWVQVSSLATGGLLALDYSGSPFIFADLTYDVTTGFGVDVRTAQLFPFASTITSGLMATVGEWYLVTFSTDLSTSATLYVNGAAVTDSSVGTPAAGFGFDSASIPGQVPGRRAHVQIYDVALTREQHLAQYRRGWDGLYGQSVDERIRAICNYAGVTDAELDLEPSDSVMPHAAFAGQKAGTLASAAAVTGGGILLTRGSELVYQDRKHRFNL